MNCLESRDSPWKDLERTRMKTNKKNMVQEEEVAEAVTLMVVLEVQQQGLVQMDDEKRWKKWRSK